MKPLQIGVCTWSLQIEDAAEMLNTVKNDLGLHLIQLGLIHDGWMADGGASLIEAVKSSGLEVSATCAGFAGEDYSTIQRIAETGGLAPDDEYASRLEKIRKALDVSVALGVPTMTMHMGFVPHEKGAKYTKMVDRAREVANLAGEKGLVLTMETGQEKATALVEYLSAVGCENVKVNFDPANMILYGAGEPVEAVEILRDHIAHVHMKDANWSDSRGESWGEEVVLGAGEADIPRVVSKLRAQGYTGALVIEREAGDSRVEDIKEGIAFLESMLT